MTTIATHTSPDWDAIGATWLLKRFGGNGFDTADVVFVNTGNPDPQVLAMADAVVDTGREFDPSRLRFDHHQLPGFRANETSATDQVFSWLLMCGVGIHHLIPLSNLILCGDTGRKEDGAHHSRLVGIHALLSAQKAKRLSDADLMAWGFSILDDLAATLKTRHDAAATLEQHTVYTSEDGLVVALHNAPQGATFAAHEQGARLVVFYSELPDVPTHARGVMRAGEWTNPHCGNLIIDVIETTVQSPEMYAELGSWYRHEAGFFCGTGTAKAPNETPMRVSIAEIARAIDEVWTR